MSDTVIANTTGSDSVEAELSTEERLAYRSYAIGSMLLNRLMDRELKEHHDLTTDDVEIMTILAESPDRRLRFGELAAITRFPKAHITYRFQRLTDRGLLDREECATDARGAFAVLTPAGEDMLRVASATQGACVRRHLLDHLSRDQVLCLSDAMGAVLAAHDGLPLSS